MSSFGVTTITTKNGRIIVLAPNSCGGTLQNLYIKLLHSSTQTSADGLNAPRQISRMTKNVTWSLFGMSKVRSSWLESLIMIYSRLFHARAAATGKAQSPRVARRVDGTCSVVVSTERRQRRRATICDVGRRLSVSDRYAGAVPCTLSVHTMVPQNTQPELDSLRDAYTIA